MSQQPQPTGSSTLVGTRGQPPQSLADVLERVLDKGIVIVGDIQVRLLDIELLTIKIRLMVASVERAQEMGINWWQGDPFVSSLEQERGADGEGPRELQQRVEALERRLEGGGPSDRDQSDGDPSERERAADGERAEERRSR